MAIKFPKGKYIVLTEVVSVTYNSSMHLWSCCSYAQGKVPSFFGAHHFPFCYILEHIATLRRIIIQLLQAGVGKLQILFVCLVILFYNFFFGSQADVRVVVCAVKRLGHILS